MIGTTQSGAGRAPWLFGVMVCVWLASLASAASAAQTSFWLREPAISPDGSRIAFRFEGQIWIAPTTGGAALPLTPSGFHSASPVWSPSGETIAFASDRFGPMNIFVAPARGGEAKRLTWYGADEKPASFTPDGNSVLFTSRRLGDASQTFAIPSRSESGEQLYEVPIAEGRDRLALPNAAFDARWDRQGRRLLYTGASIEQPFRRGQISSAARQVWLYDAASGRHERLTADVHESRDAVWSSSGDVFYLSEASGSMNVWKLSLADRKGVQITQFTGDPVRSLSISQSDDLAFSWNGDLYRLRNGASAPERIEVDIAQAAFDGERAARTTNIDDFVLSPTGKEIAVVSRGGIYVAAMNGKYIKRVTRMPGEERWPSFSPDGRTLAYAGERDGHWSLYESRIVDFGRTNLFGGDHAAGDVAESGRSGRDASDLFPRRQTHRLRRQSRVGARARVGRQERCRGAAEGNGLFLRRLVVVALMVARTRNGSPCRSSRAAFWPTSRSRPPMAGGRPCASPPRANTREPRNGATTALFSSGASTPMPCMWLREAPGRGTPTPS